MNRLYAACTINVREFVSVAQVQSRDDRAGLKETRRITVNIQVHSITVPMEKDRKRPRREE